MGEKSLNVSCLHFLPLALSEKDVDPPYSKAVLKIKCFAVLKLPRPALNHFPNTHLYLFIIFKDILYFSLKPPNMLLVFIPLGQHFTHHVHSARKKKTKKCSLSLDNKDLGMQVNRNKTALAV